mmetsp:Transcript_97088/g.274422  ORF Transcript_97088/g.274422 Transcript_97088/m.274422 type:complete len:236 (+) Transcript_97088:434-1141(+)
MERRLVSAVLRPEHTQLATQATALVPPENEKHNARLLRDVLQQKLRQDQAVEPARAIVLRQVDSLPVDHEDGAAANENESAEEETAPRQRPVVCTLVLLVESLPSLAKNTERRAPERGRVRFGGVFDVNHEPNFFVCSRPGTKCRPPLDALVFRKCVLRLRREVFEGQSLRARRVPPEAAPHVRRVQSGHIQRPTDVLQVLDRVYVALGHAGGVGAACLRPGNGVNVDEERWRRG